jgi:hypothetical protein
MPVAHRHENHENTKHTKLKFDHSFCDSHGSTLRLRVHSPRWRSVLDTRVTALSDVTTVGPHA